MNIPDKNGNYLLHFMAAIGNGHAIKDEIDSGADVNAQNKKGQTPLDIAYEKKQLEAALLLIKNGANINIRD
jgi:ankyrin repeat protein